MLIRLRHTWPRLLPTLSTGGDEVELSPWFMRRFTKEWAALTSTGVAGDVDGLANTSFKVTLEGESRFCWKLPHLLSQCLM